MPPYPILPAQGYGSLILFLVYDSQARMSSDREVVLVAGRGGPLAILVESLIYRGWIEDSMKRYRFAMLGGSLITKA